MSFWCSLKQREGFTRAPLDRLNDDYFIPWLFDVSMCYITESYATSVQPLTGYIDVGGDFRNLISLVHKLVKQT